MRKQNKKNKQNRIPFKKLQLVGKLRCCALPGSFSSQSCML